LAEINRGLTDIVVKHLNETPTIENASMRDRIMLMQRVYRTHPGAAQIVKERMQKGPPVFTLDQMRSKNQQFVEEIIEFMQGYRILCVTELNNSPRMWDRYAQGCEGIALRIVPNTDADSKFQLFRRVEYRDARPPLFDSTLSFLERSIYGDQTKDRLAMLDKIVYSKTREWEYEQEFRLAIPIHADDEWNTLPYRPEEITELYLGHKISDGNKDEIVRLAQAVNPEIVIIETSLDTEGNVTFRR